MKFYKPLNHEAIVALLISFLIFGCATTSTVSATPKKSNKEGNDSVLKSMCLGTENLSKGNIQNAKNYFSSATTSISGIWGDTPEAQKARSLWYDEAIKPFKGEPYERMMAFYYMGLLFLMDNDYGNAQASFRQSVMQDAFAEENQYRADVVLPLFLQAWALQAQGSYKPAEDAYSLVKKNRPDFKLPSMEKQPNVLLIVETGKSPRTVADGVGSYQLKFFRGKKFIDKRAKYSIDGQMPIDLYPMEDIFWQASTRGGRAVDRIVDGKVQFRETTEGLGSALTDISSELLDNPNSYGGDAEEIGLALGIVGIASTLLSGKAKPAVDTRYWDNLPDVVHLSTFHLDPGNHNINIDFYDENGIIINGMSQSKQVTIPSGQDKPAIIWISAWDRNSKRYTY